MGRRHFKPEQIIHMLREAAIKLAGGRLAGEVCRVPGQPRSTQPCHSGYGTSRCCLNSLGLPNQVSSRPDKCDVRPNNRYYLA